MLCVTTRKQIIQVVINVLGMFIKEIGSDNSSQ